ncbi:MAG: adenylate kinase [Kiritimatiellae bacterium]|nr:adenylate kinase [Kiritimatiellia bacterium]
MKIVILLGAPGSGKGTVAGQLTTADAALRHVSSGDLLRDAVRRGTPAGKEADGYMKAGKLVPDTIIAQMIADLIGGIQDSNTVLLLDGFPRNVAQAETLDGILKKVNSEISSVVLLEVPDAVIVERIAGRRSCPKCGAGYHVKFLPPKQEGICDACGGELVTRKDDNPETVQNRLDVYREQTFPLVEFYGSRVKKVDGLGQVEEVAARVKKVLD